jgi:hypothetical protein
MMTPSQLDAGVWSAYAVSLDLRGFRRMARQSVVEKCASSARPTLTQYDSLVLEARRHECQDEQVRLPEGRMSIELVTVFTPADPRGRGVHAGRFSWGAGSARWIGQLTGVTNAGTNRPDPFPEGCERCRQPEAMSGLLSTDRRSAFFRSFAHFEGTYRIQHVPRDDHDKEVPVVGTLEGVLLVPCNVVPGPFNP